MADCVGGLHTAYGQFREPDLISAVQLSAVGDASHLAGMGAGGLGVGGHEVRSETLEPLR